MTESTGIHGLPDQELMRLVRAIAREDFADPVSRAALVLAKFGHLEGELEALVGHSKRAALAIVTAILRERQRTPNTRANVAWSGPAPTGQGTLEPYALAVELIATAERSVLFAGADFARDARLLRSLHAAQRGRGLDVTVISAQPESAVFEAAHELFRTFQPWPLLYVPNAERVQGALPFCLLIDGTRGVVLAGAPPEVEAPDHALTAGFVLEDAANVAALQAQWRILIEAGALVPVVADPDAPCA